MSLRLRWPWARSSVLIVLLAFIAGSQTRGASSPDPLSPNAAAQIQALIDEKRTWTPTQQKVHSNLLYEAKQRRGLPIAPGVPTLETGIEVGPAGDVVVDITAALTSSFLDTLASLGGQVLDSHPAYRSVRAVLALDAVETLAAHPDVIFINRKQEDILNRAGPLAAEPEAPGITASLSSAVVPASQPARRKCARCSPGEGKFGSATSRDQ